jgi:hypothetical protein
MLLRLATHATVSRDGCIGNVGSCRAAAARNDGDQQRYRDRVHGSVAAIGCPESSTMVNESPRSLSFPISSALDHWLNAVSRAR